MDIAVKKWLFIKTIVVSTVLIDHCLHTYNSYKSNILKKVSVRLVLYVVCINVDGI